MYTFGLIMIQPEPKAVIQLTINGQLSFRYGHVLNIYQLTYTNKPKYMLKSNIINKLIYQYQEIERS